MVTTSIGQDININVAQDTPVQTTEKTFPVMEVFGPVIQGEGFLVGCPTMFIRLGGCDYRCEWCDSKHAVLPDLVKQGAEYMTAQQMFDAVEAKGSHCKTITISGGNPCMHNIYEFVLLLKENGYYVAVETQGTIFQEWLHMCNCVTISPKGPSSGMTTKYDMLDRFLALDPDIVIFKVVVFDQRDYEYAKIIRARYGQGYIMYLQPGTMQPDFIQLTENRSVPYENDFHRPGAVSIGVVRETILRRTVVIAEEMLADPLMEKVRIVPQMHVLMYGHKMGV